MARRDEIFVQNARIGLAPSARPRYKRRVHSAAQRGWQISGEVVVPAAQLWLDTPPGWLTDDKRRSSVPLNFAHPGTFSATKVSTTLQGGLFPDTVRSG